LKWLSVIVPTYHDDAALQRLVAQIQLTAPAGVELIVVDGVLRRRPSWLPQWVCYVTSSMANRGAQLQTGGQQAQGQAFWFLHADSQLDFQQAFAQLHKTTASVGFFTLTFNDPKWRYRWLAWSSNLRARYGHLIFGDQGLFVQQDVYRASGGFRPQPLMEDWQLSRDLHRLGVPFHQFSVRLQTSARRFEGGGFVQTLLKMHVIKFLYMIGVSPQRLVKIYERRRH
jgi:rSAM/selenodomain-associated transferase 2